MIVFEFMPPNSSHRSFAYHSLFRAANSSNNRILFWNSNDKNIYDLYDEHKPDKLIYFSNLDKQINKLGLSCWDFKKWYADVPLIADPSVYHKIDSDDNILCDLICISPYSDVDKFNAEFYKNMQHSVKNFRYFGVNIFGGHKDCGYIPENLHSLFLSSTKNVLCLSKHFAVNAFLCNENLNYKLNSNEVSSVLSTEIIKSII